MRYNIIILLLFVSLKGFSQLDTIKKPKTALIRFGRPTTKDNQPLFIVDGKPIDSKEIQNIKPETIESVTVLKDSVAKKSFDGQARNGVIIIKTKKFSKKELRKMKRKNS